MLTTLPPDLGPQAESQQPPAEARHRAVPAAAHVQRKKAALAPASLRAQLQSAPRKKVHCYQRAHADYETSKHDATGECNLLLQDNICAAKDPPAATSCSEQEWPVVITSRQDNVLRQRRSMYEAVLQVLLRIKRGNTAHALSLHLLKCRTL